MLNSGFARSPNHDGGTRFRNLRVRRRTCAHRARKSHTVRCPRASAAQAARQIACARSVRAATRIPARTGCHGPILAPKPKAARASTYAVNTWHQFNIGDLISGTWSRDAIQGRLDGLNYTDDCPNSRKRRRMMTRGNSKAFPIVSIHFGPHLRT